MGMSYSIKREEATNIIHQVLNSEPKKKLVITGLDGSGKTTELAKHIGSNRYIKTDATTSQEYFNPNESERVIARRILDHYELFDRHPIIDLPVYHYASLIESKEGTEEEFYKFLADNKELYENFNFVFFLNDKFVSQTKQNKWISILRPFIIDLYIKCIEWIEHNTSSKVFIVED
jgi:GTPase SAR1 family protein